MSFSVPKFGFILIVSTALVAAGSSAARAGDIGNYRTPAPAVSQAKAASASNVSSKLDCSPVIYDYGSTRITKTVCSPPWTGPETNAESGPAGSSSSTAQ